MSQYNVLQAIYMSFYSKKLYQDVAVNWGGKTFLYLLMLLALSWILFTYEAQHALNQMYQRDSDKIVAQVPVLTIKNGVISTPESHPYIITSPETNENIAVIDTTGKYATPEQAKTTLLITQTEIISQTKPDQVRIDKVPSNLNIVIKPDIVNNYIKSFLGYIWILLFVALVVFSYVYRIIQAILYSVIGKIFAMIFRVQLPYMRIFQIEMVSITPVIVVATIFNFFAIVFSHQILFYFILAMVYLSFGIIANKNETVTASE